MKEKRYYSLDKFYKEKFGCKICKVSLDAGFSCPNKDGTCGTGGCIFCNGQVGVGSFEDDLMVQFDKVKGVLSKKWPKAKFIPFLEANTNTYAPIGKLKSVYEKLLSIPDVVGLNIATRCDAISEEVYDYLEELSKKTFLTIELGLQSAHDETLKFLNRGHTVEQFTKCVKELKKRGINVVVHIINGIPLETTDMMLDTIRYIDELGVDGVKFHMLYIEEGTALAKMYREKKFPLMTKSEYIEILGKQLELLDKNIVVHRLVSDPNREKLIEPLWLVRKFETLNAIDDYLEENDIRQGEEINC